MLPTEVSRIVVYSKVIRNKPQRYGTHVRVIRDHTVLPATRQRWRFHLYPQQIKAGTRFSDPRGMHIRVDLVVLATYQGCIPARRWSPITVLTGLNVEQLRTWNERRTLPQR